ADACAAPPRQAAALLRTAAGAAQNVARARAGRRRRRQLGINRAVDSKRRGRRGRHHRCDARGALQHLSQFSYLRADRRGRRPHDPAASDAAGERGIFGAAAVGVARRPRYRRRRGAEEITLPTIPAQLAFPPHQRPRRRRAFLLGRFGLMPLPPYGARACPQIAEWIPPGCTARIVTDPNGCTRRVAVCPSGPQTPPAIAASSPVPANFPTNQIFVAPDGSQWMYSSSQGQWIPIGTPYSVGAPPSSAPAPVPSPAPVSVTVAPPPVAAAAASQTRRFRTPPEETAMTGMGIVALPRYGRYPQPPAVTFAAARTGAARIRAAQASAQLHGLGAGHPAAGTHAVHFGTMPIVGGVRRQAAMFMSPGGGYSQIPGFMPAIGPPL